MLAAGRPGTPSEGWIYLGFSGVPDKNLARFNLSWILEGEKHIAGVPPAAAGGIEIPRPDKVMVRLESNLTEFELNVKAVLEIGGFNLGSRTIEIPPGGEAFLRYDLPLRYGAGR